MIKLYQFPRPYGFPSFSPFCVKLETYFKMANIPYENVLTLDTKSNPKKLMPYIEVDGKIFGDSTLIIDKMVADNGDKVDFWLSTEQKAVSRSFVTLLENHLAAILAYFRWVYPQGWLQFREVLFAKAPKFIKVLVGRSVAKKVEKRIYASGLRFSVEELLHLAKKDLQALSDYLGNKQFFFGDKPSALDGLLFAVIGGTVLLPIEMPLKDLTNQFSNLVEHAKRMQQMFYSKN